jgi:hypothetical protein
MATRSQGSSSGSAGARRGSAEAEDELLSPEEYLEKHNVKHYLHDVVRLLLRARDERPLEFLADYFEEVLNGSDVLLREFSYVSSCARTRWAFVASAREALADLDQSTRVSARSLMQLLQLVCPDFPLGVAADACRLCGDEGGTHPLDRALHALSVRVCYPDLLRELVETFHGLSAKYANRVQTGKVADALADAVAGLALERPPDSLLDELRASSAADISLAELEQLVVHSSPMYAGRSPPPTPSRLLA